MKMIKQRDESAKIYADNNRPELAAQELEAIEIIKVLHAGADPGGEGAGTVPGCDCRNRRARFARHGKMHRRPEERYAGQMDFAKASGVVKDLLK